MIFDRLDHAARFAATQNLKDALRFLAETDLAALPVGKSSVDGERITCTVVDRPLTAMPSLWEDHRRYIDVHLVLTGAECIHAAPQGELPVHAAFDPAKDAALFRDAPIPRTAFTLHPGEMLILFPGEVHMTNIPANAQESVRKIILKVEV